MKTSRYAIVVLALGALVGIAWSTGALRPPAAGAAETMTVYKSPACGCCDGWIEHLREHGFTVEVEEIPDMTSVKRRLGVPPELASCHTGVVGDRVFEGHVPADAIHAFLAATDRADFAGLAVPGMPVGSPGMEVEGRPAAPYDIMAFRADGTTAVFQSR